MARRRRGRPVTGWLVLDKPFGLTSTEAVARVRRALDAQKAGHAGTLDPLATGVLPIALGEATKTVAPVQEGAKTYRFTLRLGIATDTDDAEGTPIATSAHRPADAEIAAALPAYLGEIEQVPPQYSAVKVGGARAYDLARQGSAPHLAARPLTVERLALVARPDADRAVLEMTCGKGGYVRAVARDLGRDLGCGAHVVDLRRLASGPFDESRAVTPDAVAADPEAALLPLEAGLAGLAPVRVDAAAAALIRNGQGVPVAAALDWGTPAWASLEGRAVALGRVAGGRFVPERVFAGPTG